MADDSTADDKPKPLLGLSGTQTIGSALAAVTSAVVGSFLGVAGTLIGAALGSIVATIAAALYARTLDTAAGAAKRRISRARQGGGAQQEATEKPLEEAPLAVATAVAAEKDKLRKLTPKTWIKIASASAAAFAVAMVCITAFEFGTNKPISSLVTASTTSASDTGARTTFGAAFTSTDQNPDDAEQPVDTEPSDTPVDEGTGTQDNTGTGTVPEVPEDGGTGIMQPGSGETGETLPEETSNQQAPVPAPESELEPAPAVEAPADSASNQEPQGDGVAAP
ncbi:hypothetical protein D477_006818 [Arthrobacter crystallopoietes BAB-32]|uniref:Uncharacterized protein n=1 Tax=Arthrobacter crystallopoietes BAB-32 TaxID=1246476 RepID=N1V9M6_9MICC|nr:hypothetical protein [Arthrobacter crystallopoietes]EMY34988.1 hypothetical protein D477_006818 [Arthrobacter crystallopoietes BAB-32]